VSPRFSRGFQPRSRSRKRSTSWGIGPESSPVSLSGTANALWTTGSVLGNEAKVTIVRIRGMASLFMQTATATGDGFNGAVGIGIVSAEAFAAGAASVPGPFTDSDWDGWMYHTFFNLNSSAGGLSAEGGQASQRLEIDSKAMRIFEDSETLFGAIEQVEEGTATAEFWANTRILLKLS